MNSLKIKKNDTVVVLSGKDKGKQGKVLGTIPSEAKVVVEGINKVTCHIKPRKQGEEGGITQREAAIYASKVQVVCPKCGKGTRVAYVIKDGKKARTCSMDAARANMAFMSMVGLSALMKEAVVKAAVSMTTPARMVFFRPTLEAMKPTGR